MKLTINNHDWNRFFLFNNVRNVSIEFKISTIWYFQNQTFCVFDIVQK